MPYGRAILRAWSRCAVFSIATMGAQLFGCVCRSLNNSYQNIAPRTGVADLPRQRDNWITTWGALMSWMEKLHRARLELTNHRADPWKQTLERGLRDVQAISTVAILDLLGVAPTTGNARRLAQTMRSLGFIPLKSRRLMPGGFRGTTIRGWARPLRERK